MGRPLNFWHVAGDIIWRGVRKPEPITAEQAEFLRGEFSAQSRAAFRAGDCIAARRWTQGWLDLTQALDHLDGYRRVIRAANARGLS